MQNAMSDYAAAFAAAVVMILDACRIRRQRARPNAACAAPSVPGRPRRASSEVFTLQAHPRKHEPGGVPLPELVAPLGQAIHRAAGFAGRLPWFGRRGKSGREGRGASAPMRGALEAVPAALLGIDGSGNIAFVSEKVGALFGYRREELIGAAASVLIPEWRPDALAAGRLPPSSGFGRVAASEIPTFAARRRDGTEFSSEVTTNPCRVDGVPMQLAVIVDRSEQHELHRNRQELAHLTRISALGELAGSLAHELNQPLTAILSNSQAAQRFIEADPIDVAEVRETLKDIVADNCRAGEIIRKMRSLARKGDVEWQSLAVGDLVRDVSLLVHSDAIVRGIRTTFDVALGLPAVRGDKVQLQQVLLNLLLNAFDAVQARPPEDRVVAVEVGRQPETSQPDGMVRIDVRDRGQGLTVDQLDKIFRPFFTSKPHGLGLGLSISRNIVSAHGGRLWGENNVEQGATFHVALPSEGSRDRTARAGGRE